MGQRIPGEHGDVTTLLRAWGTGDQAALQDLMPLMYLELRRMARRFMRAESSEHSLQPTALVHEAYLRLVDVARASCEDRTHFVALAAALMRRILVDHARSRIDSNAAGRCRQSRSTTIRRWRRRPTGIDRPG